MEHPGFAHSGMFPAALGNSDRTLPPLPPSAAPSFPRLPCTRSHHRGAMPVSTGDAVYGQPDQFAADMRRIINDAEFRSDPGLVTVVLFCGRSAVLSFSLCRRSLGHCGSVSSALGALLPSAFSPLFLFFSLSLFAALRLTFSQTFLAVSALSSPLLPRLAVR